MHTFQRRQNLGKRLKYWLYINKIKGFIWGFIVSLNKGHCVILLPSSFESYPYLVHTNVLIDEENCHQYFYVLSFFLLPSSFESYPDLVHNNVLIDEENCHQYFESYPDLVHNNVLIDERNCLQYFESYQDLVPKTS